jgi:hypothetical protein
MKNRSFSTFYVENLIFPYNVLAHQMVGVAQLVRAPGCGPGGRRFKSGFSPHFFDLTSDFHILTCKKAVYDVFYS